MHLKFIRLSPHASPPAQVNEHDIELRCQAIGLDGRRRDPLIPAGDARWLYTDVRLVPPIPVFVLSTPYELALSKLEALHVRNDPNAGLLVCLFSRRLDSIHLAHNTPIVLLSPLATTNFTISIKDLTDGTDGRSSNPAKHPEDHSTGSGDADN